MQKNLLVYIVIGVVIIGAAGYFLISGSDESGTQVVEKQLYTCGMHPNIIEEEPGNCPICDMRLTPIKMESKSGGERKILYWRAPMNPNEIYDAPGKSKMGMDLVPVYEDEGGMEGVVTVDGSVQQSINVKTEFIEQKELKSEVTTNGILTTDERNEYKVTTKLSGWVEKLYVNFEGQKVRKGQKLLDIYSPELVAAQQELLTALKYKDVSKTSNREDIIRSGDELLSNTIYKLELLDISKDEIDKLIKKQEIKKYMTLYAPSKGTVLMKYVIEGEKIMPGKPLLHIADLSNLWLKADVYENELNKIQVGSQAEITFSYLPAKKFYGEIKFIYPTVNPKSRTVQVRIDISNKEGDLKPAMYANVKIHGKSFGSLPVISELSVIRSGSKNIAILAMGEGRFKPIEISLGNYSDGYYQVPEGLKEGDEVVTSAQFLIDSESSLRAAVQLFSSESNTETPEGKTETNHSEMEEEHSPLIRNGIIDLQAIDENGDGKLFQDLMDWNVISDVPGECPLCGMTLQELSIDEIKKNLKENGYQYK